MKQSTTWTAVAVATVLAAGCGKSKDQDAPASSKAPPAPPSAPTPPPTPPPAPPAPPPDPFAQGFCEYLVDGAAPNKGGGGLNNVMSIHWMAADQAGRSLASPLLINCGKGQQLSLSPAADTANDAIPMKPGTYAIAAVAKPGQFTALGPGFMGGTGELVIVAWDAAHVAGNFQLTAAGDGKKYAGTFDLKCPQPGNGVCAP